MTDTGSGNGASGAAQVFVSYARPDQRWAGAVVEALQSAGYSVWWDALIPGGQRFSATIAQALERAGAVVVLWSKDSAESMWVQDEASLGRDRHCLVPLRIDDTPPPLGFRQLQTLDIGGSNARADHPAMERAVRAVGEVLGREPALPAGRPMPRVSRRAVLAAGGAAIAAVGGYFLVPRLAGRASANSVAVLPFDNLSGDKSQQYLSDGIAAELRARLSRNAALSVVGQTSSNAAQQTGGATRAIAKRLNVAYLLDGNVQVAGDIVRVAVELIDGGSGFSKWSTRFDRPMTNLFDLQEAVAAAVVGAIEPRLAGPGEKRSRSGGTRDAQAFDHYLRAKEAFDSQDDEQSDRLALSEYDAAVARDPRYAAALAGRSRAQAVIANQFAQANERQRLYDAAVRDAQQAIAAAGQFADGYAALGYALFYGKLDVLAADAPYERARQFGEGNPDVLGLYAVYRARRRQFPQAEAAIERAVALDPINPSLLKSQGRIRFARGDYDGAIASARDALRLNPAIGGAHGDIGNALLMQDKLDLAAAEFEAEKAALLAIPGRAIVAARRGEGGAAAAALAALVEAEGDNGLYQQAQVLAQMGRKAEALDALDRALAVNDSGLVYLLSDPFLAPLRDEDRFKKVSTRLHFD